MAQEPTTTERYATQKAGQTTIQDPVRDVYIVADSNYGNDSQKSFSPTASYDDCPECNRSRAERMAQRNGDAYHVVDVNRSVEARDVRNTISISVRARHANEVPR